MAALTTVAEMKSLAKSLGIKGYSRLKKDELAAAIDKHYADARKANESQSFMPLAKRHSVYTADRNGGKLSARQNRRLNKKSRKHNGENWNG